MTEALKPSEVLAKAADLIEPEGCWTQGASAKNAAGQPLGAGGSAGSAAVCWCMVGALLRAGMTKMDTTALDYARRAVPATGVSMWNDAPERTQAEVVAALRKASALAAEAGQ